MIERVLFQQQRLAVTTAKITIGSESIAHAGVISTQIEEVRPLVGVGIAGLAGLLPLSFISFMGTRVYGPYFPTTGVAVSLLVLILMAVAGFGYKVHCLYIHVGGRAIAALKSQRRLELETAQRAIAEARLRFEAANLRRRLGARGQGDSR
jgi:hypothetical protein